MAAALSRNCHRIWGTTTSHHGSGRFTYAMTRYEQFAQASTTRRHWQGQALVTDFMYDNDIPLTFMGCK